MADGIVITEKSFARLQQTLHKLQAEVQALRYRRRSVGAMSVTTETSTNTLRQAFCAQAAGDGNTIVCYLDEDSPSATQITVTCEICGGDDLNEAVPNLVVGTMLYVVPDGDLWRALFPFTAWTVCPEPE